MRIEELRKRAGIEAVQASLHVQVESMITKQTRDQKPYLEILTKDGTSDFNLRVWSDHPAYKWCAELPSGAFMAIEGEFQISPNFGLEARNWAVRPLDEEEKLSLLSGPSEWQEKQKRDFESIKGFLETINDPRLRRLSALFLAEFGERFSRAAGARQYHHARRGGLIEHVAQMMRAAEALVPIYPNLNRDLLLTGILFHDAGKMWENCYGKESFVMPYDLWGELLGHISIGIELVNRLWNRLKALPDYDAWHDLETDSEMVRLHLIHLVAAHHGEKQFGSPVEPKTPEAMVLHLVDNLDAKMEMYSSAYQNGQHLSSEIIARVRPLPGNLVQPLPKFSQVTDPPDLDPWRKDQLPDN
jgi:3'-5' exoribonuclease